MDRAIRAITDKTELSLDDVRQAAQRLAVDSVASYDDCDDLDIKNRTTKRGSYYGITVEGNKVCCQIFFNFHHDNKKTPVMRYHLEPANGLDTKKFIELSSKVNKRETYEFNKLLVILLGQLDVSDAEVTRHAL